MDKVENIPTIMKRHHSQIEGLLNRFKLSDYDLKLFNRFKWELEKHFFIEEKAIFTFIYSEDRESNEMKDELLKDHRAILKNLKDFESNLIENNVTDLSVLQQLLFKHKDFEDEKFYPMLEEELDDEKKKEIMDRISNPM